jgi:hypothetical protein
VGLKAGEADLKIYYIHGNAFGNQQLQKTMVKIINNDIAEAGL